MDMVCKLHKSTVALVHQMPFMMDQQGLGATVEKVGVVLMCWLYPIDWFTTPSSRYWLPQKLSGIVDVDNLSIIHLVEN